MIMSNFEIDISILLESLPASVYWKDCEGIYRGCNQRMVASIGLTNANQIIGKNEVDLQWYEKIEELPLSQKTMIENREFIVTVNKKNTDSKNYLLVENPIKNKVGKKIGVIGILTDITQQKIAQSETAKQLRMSNIYLKNILNNLPEPIYWMDRNGVILGCNQAEADIFGFKTAQDVIGKSIYDMAEILGWDKKIADDVRKNDLEIMQTKIAKSVEESAFSLEGKVRTFLSHKAPLYDEHNNVIGIIGTAVDISERKTNELAVQEQLRMSNIYLENILDNLPEPIYWIDENSVILGCNEAEAKIFGFKTAKEAIGKNMYDIAKILGWEREIPQILIKNDKEIMRTQTAKSVEESVLSLHGKARTFISHKAPLFDENQNVIGIIGTSIDITPRKEMEEDLRKSKEKAEAANRAKGEFLANMSHDVKTPLSGIISLAELITPHLQEEDQYLTNEIMASGKTLMTFFENCIELSKLESGSFSLADEVFSLKELVNEIVQLFRPAIRARNLGMYINYDEKIPPNILSNRASLYRILLNLIGNAIKFTKKGSITLDVHLNKKSTSEKSIVEFSIIDTGIGIPKDKLADIFERFSRVTPSYEGVYEGSGIGLSIVQKFVHMMRGKIHVKSQEGKGSKFKVTMPLKVAVEIEDIQEDENKIDFSPILPDSLATSVKKKSAKKKLDRSDLNPSAEFFGKFPAHILLIEDDPTAQKTGATRLRSLGCYVDVAGSGKQALASFRPGKYHLIFADIGLPDMPGYEVVTCIRNIEKGTGSHVPILGLSAHVAKEEQQLGIEAGMNEMLSKPLLTEQAKASLAQYVFSTTYVSSEKPAKNTDVSTLAGDLQIISLQKHKIKSDPKIKSAWNVLVDFIEILPKDIAEIKEAYKSNDVKILREKVHRLHGAVCYTNTPQFLKATKELELCLKSEKHENLNELYQDFLKAVDVLNKTYKSLQTSVLNELT